MTTSFVEIWMTSFVILRAFVNENGLKKCFQAFNINVFSC